MPRSTKYRHVRGNLDTGLTVRNVKPLSTREFLRRQNEIFGRMRSRDLADRLHVDPALSLYEAGPRTGKGAPESKTEPDSRQELHESKASSPTEAEAKAGAEAAPALATPALAAPQSVLLLDLREFEDFKACRIKTAASYPLVNVNQDRFTADMYRFKNKEGKDIVVYSDDERVASAGAKCLAERGFSNVSILTGGLRVFGNAQAHLLDGALPERLVVAQVVSPTESAATRREQRRRRRSAELEASGGASTIYAGSVSGCSIASSFTQRSTFARAPRWKEERGAAQQHREMVARMHNTQ